MRRLLIATAAIEAGAGLALLGAPSLSVSLVLGTVLETSIALTVARLAAIALLSLGIACWLARKDAGSMAAAGLAAGMLFYNTAAVALFVWTNFGLELAGTLLWPAVILHVVMALWCIMCLRDARAKVERQ